MRSFFLTVELLEESCPDGLRIGGRVGGGPLRVGDTFTTLETHELVRTPSEASSRVVAEQPVQLVVIALQVNGTSLGEVWAGSVALVLLSGSLDGVIEATRLVGVGG